MKGILNIIMKINKRINGIAEIPSRLRHGFKLANFREVWGNLQQNSSFKYVNGNRLDSAYYETIRESFTDPHIYLVFSDTKSGASEIISVFTNKKYNHASISFDKNLDTVISYNSGMKIANPGLNRESIDILLERPFSSLKVYQLDATYEQKKLLLDRIVQINEEGNAYNFLGLVTKKSIRPNIMFCSQFVYRMLKDIGLAYFEKNDACVKPSDFSEYDYEGRLSFLYEKKTSEPGSGMYISYASES